MLSYHFDKEATEALNEGLEKSEDLASVFSKQNNEQCQIRKTPEQLDEILEGFSNGIDTQIIHGIPQEEIEDAVRHQTQYALLMEV